MKKFHNRLSDKNINIKEVKLKNQNLREAGGVCFLFARIGLYVCVTPPDQMQNDTDRKFGIRISKNAFFEKVTLGAVIFETSGMLLFMACCSWHVV